VLNKPAGLVVHPGAGQHSGTLVNALLHHARGQLSGIGGVARPGIVHRLDKQTSGVMVVAKTDLAHRALSAQFADHGRSGALERSYQAIVWGAPRPPKGRIEGAIGRDPHHPIRMAVRPDGKPAITQYDTVRHFITEHSEPPVATELICRLETGRTHQIRVHCTHIGHPLLGDPVYGTGFKTKIAKLNDAATTALDALPMLEPQEEYMLPQPKRRILEHEDTKAAHKLVTSHLRLVAKIAMGYRGYGLPIGEVDLRRQCRADAGGQEIRSGARLPPRHLRHVVDQGLDPGIHPALLEPRQDGHHRQPEALFFNLRKVKSRFQALEDGDLRPDQVAEIATKLNVSEEEVVSMNRRLSGDASLNAPISASEGESGQWQDWLVDDSEARKTCWSNRTSSKPPRHAQERARRAQRARKAHLRGPPPARRSDHAGGSLHRVRHQPRARPPDRGPRLRKGPGRREEGRRRWNEALSRSRRTPPDWAKAVLRTNDRARPVFRARPFLLSLGRRPCIPDMTAHSTMTPIKREKCII
jgi:RluA family pseudouridine synthase